MRELGTVWCTEIGVEAEVEHVAQVHRASLAEKTKD